MLYIESYMYKELPAFIIIIYFHSTVWGESENVQIMVGNEYWLDRCLLY